MPRLYNTGINEQLSGKELDELFGGRGDMFLTNVPARLASERGYGNMANKKKPLKPSYDVNACFPTPKTTYGIFNMVKTDFPKGAGGVEPNPMWADGTYDQMKADFQRQAERQIESENIRNLIPERDLRYDLAKYSGGTAQQNKLDFVIGEMYGDVKRKELTDRINAIQLKYPHLKPEDARTIAINEMAGKAVSGNKAFATAGAETQEILRNAERVKLEELVPIYDATNRHTAVSEAKFEQAMKEAQEAHLTKGGTQAVMPTAEKKKKEYTNEELYRAGRLREMGGVDYTGGGVPPQQAPSRGTTKEEISAEWNRHFEYAPSNTLDWDRFDLGHIDGVGSGRRPMPLQAGGGGGAGGMRRGGGTSIPVQPGHITYLSVARRSPPQRMDVQEQYRQAKKERVARRARIGGLEPDEPLAFTAFSNLRVRR